MNMNMTKTIEKAADKTAQTAEHAADHAENGIDKTRALTNRALDKADAKVQDLQDDVRPTIEALASRVEDLASRVEAYALGARDIAQEGIHDATQQTRDYVSNKPFQSVAMAAAAGAVLAFLLGRKH